MSLAGYEFQLKQVKDSLALDPNNENLKAIARKIENLIELHSKSLDDDFKQGSTSTKLIDLCVGEKCEAKDEKNCHWGSAHIQSISSDKLSCTVIFADGRAQHCIKSQVRRLATQSSEPSKAVEVAHEKDSSKVYSKPSKSLKRKHTRQEHEQKKEAEQKGKQLSWQTFSSKISKPSIFKKTSSSFKK